jgi:hypothetical protein
LEIAAIPPPLAMSDHLTPDDKFEFQLLDEIFSTEVIQTLPHYLIPPADIQAEKEPFLSRINPSSALTDLHAWQFIAGDGRRELVAELMLVGEKAVSATGSCGRPPRIRRAAIRARGLARLLALADEAMPQVEPAMAISRAEGERIRLGGSSELDATLTATVILG